MTEPYGDEILFVGSGGIFEFRDKRNAIENMQRELQYLMRNPDPNADERPKSQSRSILWAKDAIKKVLHRYQIDLYDLGAWTVFSK